MAIVPDAGTMRTGYPFNFPEDDYVAEQRLRETRDLQREVTAGYALLESLQYLALETADDDDGTRDYLEHQLPAMLAELERRQRLLNARKDDRFRPRWPKSDDAWRDRVSAVRLAWPIERFCRELLACELIPTGRDRFKALCPLPGHNERTPSFWVYIDTDSAYCFGCKRGGDALKLTQYVLNLDRFTDALTALEQEGGVR